MSYFSSAALASGREDGVLLSISCMNSSSALYLPLKSSSTSVLFFYFLILFFGYCLGQRFASPLCDEGYAKREREREVGGGGRGGGGEEEEEEEGKEARCTRTNTRDQHERGRDLAKNPALPAPIIQVPFRIISLSLSISISRSRSLS